ncbi:MAG: polyprenyl synthetase family protein [bacterium]|nr:polyprenyl synthetase family protein [bacterium]
MEFQKELIEYKNQIDSVIKEYLEKERERASLIDSSNVKIIDFITNFCLRGGKRIRPILFVKGYEAVGGKNLPEITHTSICMEFLETYLLIHDDIIDQDAMRRGGPSFHKMSGGWKRDPRFGVSSAIIAGDMLGSLSSKVIMEANFREDLKLRALKEFTNAEIRCFHGELYDVILEHQNEVCEKDFFKMIDLKTASYTTQAPLIMGAILGNGTDVQIETLRKYGKLLGEAFQIIDDILGTFGDKNIIGKPVDSDIKQGKKTLLLIYAFKYAKKEDKNFLKMVCGNKKLTKSELQRVKNILIKTGSLAYSQNKAQELVNQAKAILNQNNLNSKTKNFLNQFSDFIIKREL